MCTEQANDKTGAHNSVNQLSAIEKMQTATPQEIRQRLAGLIDVREAETPEFREALRDLAVKFTAALPAVFGEQLERKTLWQRIGTAIEAALSKTAGGDVEFFVDQVLAQILADRGRVCANDELTAVLATLDSWDSDQRHAWLTYFATHLSPIMMRGRVAWVNRSRKKETEK